MVDMSKLWYVPNLWDNNREDVVDVQVAHAVDGMIKYCESCNHCYEKKHYTDNSTVKPYYIYEGFPTIGKERVKQCPYCKE